MSSKRGANVLGDISQEPNKRQRTSNAVPKQTVYRLTEDKENLINPSFAHNYASNAELVQLRNKLPFEIVDTAQTTKLIEAVAIMEPDFERFEADWDERFKRLEQKLEQTVAQLDETKQTLQGELNQTKQKLAETNQKLAKVEDRVETLQGELDQTKQKCEQLVRDKTSLQLRIFQGEIDAETKFAEQNGRITNLTNALADQNRRHQQEMEALKKQVVESFKDPIEALQVHYQKTVADLLQP
eukprot:TRINITY_DN5486_c0_g1_i1.p1 TRINITY_DN5486_c0_g1~~TRINITY_DN5486_c0_g1_i1.p1  ORF type:complete len:253 (-),score=16.27 TRINITY_DN5486_c0_g1_i1:48-773(-)